MYMGTYERRGLGARTADGVTAIRLFGCLTVRSADGRQVPASAFRTAKTRHLLRLLALGGGAPVRTDRLLEQLWPDAAGGRERASLRTATAQLRRVLGPDAVLRTETTIRLVGCWVDVVEFESLAERALRAFAGEADTDGIPEALRAVGLYRGHLADDEPYLDPVLQARRRLRDLLGELLLETAAAHLRAASPGDAVALAGRVADGEPTSERACRLLMCGYAALGEPSRALRAFDRCRRALAEELGASPSPATARLHLQLLAGEPAAALVA